MTAFRRIAVIGGGAWGTALANVAAVAGRQVDLWLRDAAAADDLQRRRENVGHLPGIVLHERVAATARLDALASADATLVCVPTQALRAALAQLRPHLGTGPVVVCAKGIEQESGAFVGEIARATLPGAAVAVLSGPGFARDVAAGLPTALTLAAADEALAAGLSAALSGLSLRFYHTADLRGVEIGGAAKNVLAIAAGMIAGRGLGESARAALIARGFAEIVRFATAEGARAETLFGLSGLGDVVLSCGSASSRNFAFGERLGAGRPIAEAAAGRLVEGAWTAPVLVALARRSGVEMPIAEGVAAILAGRIGLDEMVGDLMMRPLKAE